MNDLNARVDALKALLGSERSATAARSLAGAVVELCRELLPAGRATDALRLLDAVSWARDMIPADVRLRVDVTRVSMLLGAHRYTEAADAAQEIEASASDQLDQQVNLADELQVLRGACLWGTNRAYEAIALLMRVRERLLTEADSALLASCAIYLSMAYWTLGETDAALRMTLDALVAARRIRDSYLEAVAQLNYAVYVRRACRWAESEDAGHNALRLLDESGNRHHANHARRGLAILEWRRGRLERALQLADLCVSEATVLDSTMQRAFACLLRTAVLTHMGRYEEAEQAARTVPAWGTAVESRAAVLSLQYLGDIHLERGDVEGALDTYVRVYAKGLTIAPKGDIVGDVHCRRAECHYLMGLTNEAYEEARIALDHWRALGDRYEEAATYRILALSAAAVGKPDEAKKWFDEGFAFYEDIQTPYEWGKLWMAYGDWLLGPHAGIYADRRAAHEAYLAAQDHFERIGAKAKLAEANERLAGLSSDREGAPTISIVKDEPRRTPRRPRGALDLDRRSAWAFETFGLVTRSPSMLALLDDVATLAKSDTPMLVLGESGTGKELVARGIHALSGRKGTFMAINAGSLPREIIESELFGHMAGAFTGATRDKVGIFEVCNKGTVFLDEIAEMSTELQSRLLRFLETGESRRVGANGNIAVDTRIIAATNRERRDLERGKDFRIDLYYRLAHAVITLPPLRQRGDDVRMLVEHFRAEACAAAGREVELSPAAMQSLVDYAWPGNVRQLRAVIKRVVLLAKDGRPVTPEQLELHNAEVPTTLNGELEVEERRLVQEALAKAGGSRAEAARMLGVPRTTLVNKIRRFGL